MTTKSSLKKLMALNLALIMIFSSIGFTFAAENDVGENYYAYYEQDVPDKEDGDEALNNEDDAEIPGEDEGIEAPGEEDIEAPGEECDNEASGEEDIEAPETESPESPTVSGEQAIIATSVVTTWEQLQAAVWNHAVSTIVLGADITAHVGSASLWIDRAVRIEGQHNLFLDAGMIWIEDSGHLTLDGPIVRPNPSDSLRSAIFVSGGTFTLESGTVFGNTNVDSVYVGGQGTFNMMGGALENLDPANTTSTGVLLISGGIFNMSGGIISGFQWPIFMMSNQAVSVNMTGGTITDSGSVNVSPGSSFNMQGGYITNLTNFLSVSVMGEFTMNGGNIHSNDEHGVVVGGNGRFTMNGGIIRDNHWSGVIVLPDGVFTMNDGSIHNNGYGGVGTWGEFIMNGGSIRYNEDSGVNILTSTQFNGRFTMN
ncbi:MAG: hypothetical protein LBE35_00970, partial [Clostridiales bacterium]|nr:hypothetical protein [Clostridiales bacterium]